MGLYTYLQAEDAELEGVPRIHRADILATKELLSRCFPGGSGGCPAPDKCTLMDMGAGYGGTARVAVKEFGCEVHDRVSSHGVPQYEAFNDKTFTLDVLRLLRQSPSYVWCGIHLGPKPLNTSDA